MIIAGGGTGGHLFPGIALAREFERQRPGSRIVFVGSERGLEKRIVPQEGYELRLIPIGGLVGQGISRKLQTVLRMPSSLWRSYRILREDRPDLVIGVGGYASGPVMAMAALLGYPRVLVEPNAVPGLTNRLLGPWVHRIYLAFEETRRSFGRGRAHRAMRIYGNPVRREIAHGGSSVGRGPKQTLLVMGGSQGARAVNLAMGEALTALERLRPNIRIIHQTGETDAVWVRERYERYRYDAVATPFLTTVAEAYRAADLVVCRAGATTVAELASCGLPAVLIPFPHATHDHQEKNARALAEAGAAEVILERDLTGERLARLIADLLTEPERLARMAARSRALGRPEAAERIVTDCLDLVDSAV